MLPVKVLIADDHVVLAEALGSLLKEKCRLAGTVHDGVQLVEAMRADRSDIVIADVTMPKMTGLEAMRQLKKDKISCHFIFLTMHAEPRLVREALEAGASGYLLKESAGEELIHAIQEVLKGNVYISPSLTKGVFMDSTAGDPTRRLTPRQRQVLRLVSEGHSAKSIASILEISTRTVETYKYEMMQTLGLKTTAQLIRYAIDNQMHV